MTGQDKITRFGLIRHAQTLWNLEKKIQGHSDSPLTAAGERQAARWGQLLKPCAWDRIIASDAGRAHQTAKLINDILNVVTWEKLKKGTVAAATNEQDLEVDK